MEKSMAGLIARSGLPKAGQCGVEWSGVDGVEMGAIVILLVGAGCSWHAAIHREGDVNGKKEINSRRTLYGAIPPLHHFIADPVADRDADPALPAIVDRPQPLFGHLSLALFLGHCDHNR
jgi:hypothetical protein